MSFIHSVLLFTAAMEKGADGVKVVQAILDWTVGEVINWLYESTRMHEKMKEVLVELFLSQDVDGKMLQAILTQAPQFDRFSKMAALNSNDGEILKEELDNLFRRNQAQGDDDYQLALRLAAGEDITQPKKPATTTTTSVRVLVLSPKSLIVSQILEYYFIIISR